MWMIATTAISPAVSLEVKLFLSPRTEAKWLRCLAAPPSLPKKASKASALVPVEGYWHLLVAVKVSAGEVGWVGGER